MTDFKLSVNWMAKFLELLFVGVFSWYKPAAATSQASHTHVNTNTYTQTTFTSHTNTHIHVHTIF